MMTGRTRLGFMGLVLVMPVWASAQQDVAGHWGGSIEVPGQKLEFNVDLVREGDAWSGDISIPVQQLHDRPLAGIEIDGGRVRFQIPGIPGTPTFNGELSDDGQSVTGGFVQGAANLTFEMTRGVNLAKRARAALEGYREFVDQARQDWNVPGFAIGIVADDEVVFAEGFGYRDIEKKLPVDTRTLFAIGSCSKAFTTFVIGTLVEEGVVEWDKPVIHYLPGFRMHDPEVTSRLTVRDLVTHRSGLPRHDLVWYNNHEVPRSELVDRIAHLPLSKDLRETFQYNNLLYMTAGYLAGQVTGGTWEDAVRYRIFQKLGMKQSNFSVKESQKSDNYALPYEEKEDQVRRVNFRDITNVGPAGSINSNIDEMVRWVRMQLNEGTLDGTTLIDKNILKDMHAPHMAIAALPSKPMFSPMSYGLGWMVRSYHGHLEAHHGGGIDGFITHVALYPNDRVGVVAFMNITNSGFPVLMARHAVDRILELPEHDWNGEALASRAEGKKLEEESKSKKDVARKPDTRPTHPLAEFAGRYHHPGYGTITVADRDEELELTFHGIVTRYEHWHYNVFNGRENPDDHTFEDNKVRFDLNMNGDIHALATVMEPTLDEIAFTRMVDRRMTDPDYLRQFTGEYALGPQVVTVALKGNRLTVNVPGQPTYELEPDQGDRFNLKGMNGFSVEFLRNDQDQSIARFHQPNGVFDATRSGT